MPEADIFQKHTHTDQTLGVSNGQSISDHFAILVCFVTIMSRPLQNRVKSEICQKHTVEKSQTKQKTKSAQRRSEKKVRVSDATSRHLPKAHSPWSNSESKVVQLTEMWCDNVSIISAKFLGSRPSLPPSHPASHFLPTGADEIEHSGVRYSVMLARSVSQSLSDHTTTRRNGGS